MGHLPYEVVPQPCRQQRLQASDQAANQSKGLHPMGLPSIETERTRCLLRRSPDARLGCSQSASEFETCRNSQFNAFGSGSGVVCGRCSGLRSLSPSFFEMEAKRGCISLNLKEDSLSMYIHVDVCMCIYVHPYVCVCVYICVCM